jgi:lactate dehydrogenase-like 2-hydroxyacid dehydrogenase
MKRWNVYVTRMLPQPAIDLLAEYCEVEVNPEDRVLTREELLEKVQGRDAVIPLLTDTIDAEIFDAAENAKIFANYAVGFNNIDISAATTRGILVSNTPGVLTDATADMAWALLMAAARRIVEGDKFTRAGKFKGWGPMMLLGQEVTGKTLGIIGGGRIGSEFALRAKGFRMRIIYTDIKPNPTMETETGALFVDKETLLQEADFIALHVPLTPETHHLISEKELKIMKNTAVLVNTSRGPVIDEIALAQALKAGDIWAAGLDVYEWEPEITPALLELDNVVLLPHIASATFETRTKMGLIAVENVLAAMRGELPPNCLNPEAKQRQN